MTVKDMKRNGMVVETGNVRMSKGTSIPGNTIHCLTFKIEDDLIDPSVYAEEKDDEG
jgi:hypothetical protein